MPQILKAGSKGLNTENWKVYHPDGTHMFTCGEKKKDWYLSNGLAMPKKSEDFAIQLTFKPKGYGFKEGEVFGLAGRKVRCVVTGINEGLQRHHVVPYCYRTHFPEEYKTKNHHDVVLISYKCHEEYELHATEFKNQLAGEYDVKTLNEYNLEYTKLIYDFSSNKRKILSKFYSIFRNYNTMPPEILLEILKEVSEITPISFEKLKTLNYLQAIKLYFYLREKHSKEFEYFQEENAKKFDHGYHLVSKLDTHEKLDEFIKRWRSHFIEIMEPRYMPKGWSIDFRTKIEL